MCCTSAMSGSARRTYLMLVTGTAPQTDSDRIGPRCGPNPSTLLNRYIEVSTDVHFARTLVPTEVIAAIAATTINPTINAYSSTSPPFSSLISFFNMSYAFLKNNVQGPFADIVFGPMAV